MQLRRIKLAGFKSFVDPTTFHLPSRLVGIVGPNGCGKSNFIDAVRWVMGESSAKTLRGESMADVIFNGSTVRKPVGQASVELVFDNSDGRIGGNYARYAEISVRRQVSRDGQSVYSLNGTRCRRKDITDVFLGTGFGPRSYSIIEQGMISRLVEARPEDLRNFLEEAAGISKYKERRKETESRLNETRENLNRLEDIRTELRQQLSRLARQAEAASRYQELKTEERTTRGQLLALRWRTLDQQRQGQEQSIQASAVALEGQLATLRHTEAELEEARETARAVQDAFAEVQGEVYAAGAEVARVEQALQHARDGRKRQAAELERARTALAQAVAHRGADQEEAQRLVAGLADQEEALAAAEELAAITAEDLAVAEGAWTTWQARWEDLNRTAQGPAQTAQVERTRLTHLEQQQDQLTRRRERLEQEAASLDPAPLEAEVERLEEALEAHDAHQEDLTEALTTANQAIGTQRDANHHLASQLDRARSHLQHLRGRLTSLETLQQAALGKGKGAVAGWLERHDLLRTPRLAEGLEVAHGWERAVEVVLGPHLEAVCVPNLPATALVAVKLEKGMLGLWSTSPSQQSSPSSCNPLPEKASSTTAGPRLTDQVRAPWPMTELLSGIYTAPDLSAALTLRDTLALGESVVTPDGLWLGRDWLRVVRDSDGHAGMLAREQDIRHLRTELEAAEDQVEAQATALEEGRIRLADLERGRERAAAASHEAARTHADLRARLSTQHARLEQVQARVVRLRGELTEVVDQVQEAVAQSEEVRHRLHEALEQVDAFAEQRNILTQERDERRITVERTRAAATNARDQAHRLALEVRTVGTRLDATRASLLRIDARVTELTAQVEALAETLAGAEAPIDAFEAELRGRLTVRLEVEGQLNRARRRVEDADHRLRKLERGRTEGERIVEELRTELTAARVAHQEVVVRAQGVEEQATEAEVSLPDILTTLPAQAEEAPWQERLDTLARQIQRLGAINLAAIEEHKAASERSQYLEAQHTDLSAAVETLENAIRRIDRETRQRFQETFDQVNEGLKVTFPRLFGGGHAYLELTGENLLETGVTIMARPPGKRNSTIHLLSGGEKALTAVALVFSIFQLNPSPVCLLDEVDAPLDEANVGRFCRMVQEMSEKVQFIFITHNKATMEMAEHLTGVTMQEPGVSRLVTVDVAEAVQLVGA
ncbi:Chromosome partition protein Smc [Gammaproteobacteria bacterium]